MLCKRKGTELEVVTPLNTSCRVFPRLRWELGSLFLPGPPFLPGPRPHSRRAPRSSRRRSAGGSRGGRCAGAGPGRAAPGGGSCAASAPGHAWGCERAPAPAPPGHACGCERGTGTGTGTGTPEPRLGCERGTGTGTSTGTGAHKGIGTCTPGPRLGPLRAGHRQRDRDFRATRGAASRTPAPGAAPAPGQPLLSPLCRPDQVSPWSDPARGDAGCHHRQHERLLAQAGLLRRGEAPAQEEEETDRPLHDRGAHELRAPDTHRLRGHGCGRGAAHDWCCPGDEVQGRPGATVEQLPSVVAYSWLFQPKLELPDPPRWRRSQPGVL